MQFLVTLYNSLLILTHCTLKFLSGRLLEIIAAIFVCSIHPQSNSKNVIASKKYFMSISNTFLSIRYNIQDSNINDSNFEKLDKEKIPDVILVKKYYGNKATRRKLRIWKLKHLAEQDTALNTDENEYNEFLEDLEEDPTLRQNVNIFKDNSKQIPVDADEVIDSTVPHVTLEEMLDDLTIEDVEMQET